MRPMRKIGPICLIGFLGLISLVGLMAAPKRASAAILSAPPNNLGMVGYWNFNENSGTIAADRSGGGNNGTLINGPTWAQGKFASGLSFDGTNDYVDLGTGASLNPTNQVTVSYWYKRSSGVKSHVGKWFGNISQQNYLLQVYSDNKIYWNISSTGSNDSYELSDATFTDTNWNHLVGVYNGSSGSQIVYLNGSVLPTTHQGVAVPANMYNATGASITVNYYYGAGAQYGGGSIDDVRIYNRALSAAEVATLYRSTGTTKIARLAVSGLVGYWPLNEGGNTNRTIDSSGGGNTGYLSPGASGTNTTYSSMWTTGKYGSGVSFDGTDDKIDFGAGTKTTMNFTNNFTVGVWLKATNFNCVFRGLVVHMDPTNGWGLVYNSDNGCKLNFLVFNGGSYHHIDVNSNPSAGEWHHLVGVIRSGTVYLYLDGVQQTGTMAWLPGSNTTSNLVASGFYSASTGDWNGSLDDIQIYNRALSATEITAWYNAGRDQQYLVRVNSTLNNSASNLQNGLVGWWPFDGAYQTSATSTDLSGQGNHGALAGASGAQNLPQRAIGKLGQALKFDGTDDYVGVGATSIYNTTAGAVSLWVKLNTQITVNNSYYTFVSTGPNNEAFGWKFEYYKTVGGVLTISFRKWTPEVYANRTYTLPVGEWTHLVATWDGSNSRLFVNGALHSTVAQASPTTGSDIICFGADSRGDCSGQILDGSLDDVRIYNKALTASEVLQLYNAGK